MTAEFEPPKAEYLYGRVMLPGLAKMVLGGEQAVHEDTMTFKRYAESREDGREFAKQLLGLSAEIRYLGDDMLAFVEAHQTEKWED